MKLDISNKAAIWYKEELDIEESEDVRFFVRYGGVGGKIPGFSLGIKKDHPQSVHTSATVEGITFYIEDSDLWYFEESDLAIEYDDVRNEPVLKYV
ncbi:HesB/YadR/YfhF family protein [Oceanobacillus damuensis]|uniref:HesB/YadR/YfhF family protein n=1 Tax=Oceanobacillus damuensis TaxID=937928 RepID=UPI000836BC2B|nr:HesB/YadR/YfhF family protein [Oceanobacillus damuensis]